MPEPLSPPTSSALSLSQLFFKAHHYSTRFKMNAIRKEFAQVPVQASGMELIYRFEHDQWVCFYAFGSVVFFNSHASTEHLVCSILKSVQNIPDVPFTTEDFAAQKGSSLAVDFEKVTVPKFEVEQVSIISWVLAQSVALEYFEHVVDKMLEQSGSISELLEVHGRIKHSRHEITKFIGFCTNTKQKILSSTFILDMPEPTWSKPQLEQLYIQMADQFEIKGRYRTLEHK